MNPIYVAVDTGDLGRAETLARTLGNSVGGLKLGMEFFMAQGPEGVRRMGAFGLPIFLDLKLHDIPNTVAGAMRSLSSLDLAITNVHAAGGAAMMRAARDAMRPETKVIAVTVLTSIDEADLESIGVMTDSAAQVARLAELTKNSGLDGIVCSGHEVSARHSGWPEGQFIVPGLRPGGKAEGDQKRVKTPRDALDAGATVLVIGRPITGASDPAAAAREILTTLT
jgi:orotidine-5'-phosphate decarboxylase